MVNLFGPSQTCEALTELPRGNDAMLESDHEAVRPWSLSVLRGCAANS
jgi:hypothetical protein